MTYSVYPLLLPENIYKELTTLQDTYGPPTEIEYKDFEHELSLVVTFKTAGGFKLLYYAHWGIDGN